ncbi:hypothetical protein OHB01_25270 [Microbispora hainanensis]|nr:hypothetical protein [Microbispora hainanensis]
MHVLQRLAAPQVQGPAQLTCGHQLGELLRLDLSGRRLRDVAAGARLQEPYGSRAAQHLADRGDRGVDLRPGGVGPVVTPHRVDQPLDADHAAGVEQEVGQDSPVTWGDARQRRAVDDHLDGAEQGEAQHRPPITIASCAHSECINPDGHSDLTRTETNLAEPIRRNHRWKPG